jgi:hypothetical protein
MPSQASLLSHDLSPPVHSTHLVASLVELFRGQGGPGAGPHDAPSEQQAVVHIIMDGNMREPVAECGHTTRIEVKSAERSEAR